MPNHNRRAPSEIPLRHKVAAGVVGGLTLIGVGARINSTIDNDDMYRDARPAPATAKPAAEHELDSEEDKLQITIKSGDTASELADGLVDGDWRAVNDEIMAAASEDGHPGLQAGEKIVINKP